MSVVNHNHYVTTQRGGAFMSGDSAAGGNITSQKIDTPEYSTHNLSHTIRTTAVAGELYPIDHMSVLPGDSVHMDGNLITMFLPTNKPFLDEWEQTLHTYFCPNRLLDPTWTMFMTGGKDGTYSQNRPCFDLHSIASMYVNLPKILTSTSTPNVDMQKATSAGQSLDLFHLPCGDYLSDIVDDGRHAPVLFDKFVMIQRVYNDFYRLPEWETDMFLDIPETPQEVADNFFSHMMYWANNTLGISGATVKDGYSKFVTEAYEYLNSHDGYYWRFYEWLCKNPSNVINSSEVNYANTALLQIVSQSNHASFALTHRSTSVVGDMEYMSADAVASTTGNCGFATSHLKVDVAGKSFIYDQSTPVAYTGNQLVAIWEDDATGNTQYISPESVINTMVGVFLITTIKPHSMCYERDKYNVILPYTQRGVAAKLAANIYSDVVSTSTPASTSIYKRKSTYDATGAFGDTTEALTQLFAESASNPIYALISQNDLRNLRADTSFLEKAAKFGYRYSEYLRGLFGITSDVTAEDHARYIGGLKSGINATRITNMSASSVSETGAVQIGQWSGEAGTNANGKIGSWTAAENGYIISFYCCKPRLTYMHIADPENHKIADRTQYFTPDYANIQEQPQSYLELAGNYAPDVFAKFVNGINTSSAYVVGNVPRYQEYRQIPSTVHGQLADDDMADYEAFTCARDMNTLISLVPASNDGSADIPTLQHVRPNDTAIRRLFQVDPNECHPLIIEFGVGINAARLVPAFAHSL